MSCCIRLADGSVKQFSFCPSALDLAKNIGPSLAKNAVGVLLNKESHVQDIRSVLQNGDQVEILAIPSEKALEVVRHSAAHVLAQAVQNLWPDIKVTIGPVIENGFYYDFDTDKTFTSEDLERIEKEMKSLLKRKYELSKEVWTKEKACSYFEQKGEFLKKEIIEGLEEAELSIYKQGPWLDLCRGPHVQHLGQIGAVKVLSQSGAYWRGDSKNKQLKRIYGTAFHTEKQLKAFLKKQEEAKQNDHRQIGKKLDLFWFSELSAGSPFFTPLGTAVYRRMQEFLREKYKEYGYAELITPQIYHSDLFDRSGHIRHFAENMYLVLEEGIASGWKEKKSEIEAQYGGKLELSKLSAKNNKTDVKKRAEQGLELLEAAVMEVLGRHDGIGPKDLSEETGLPGQTGSHIGQNDQLVQWLLDDLKEKGKADNKERGQWKVLNKSRQLESQEAIDQQIDRERPVHPQHPVREFFLKPMNCPGHCLLYKKDRKSYRDLPWRVADFGRLHRKEPAGALQGLTRVKSFCQDDAHIFCRLDQLSQEIQTGIQMLQEVYKIFGLENYKIELSTRPKDRMGEDHLWDQAEEALGLALKALNIPYDLQPGEGAFYGPKLDIKVQDAFDRSWQLGTFQCDFNLPRAFDLTYISEKDREERPVMLHRAILGSLERFIGIYLEHSKGRLPAWLSPVPVIVLPLTDKEKEFSTQIQKTLEQKRIICKIDGRNEKLSYKIRESQNQQIPYMLIVGKKEVQSQLVSVRLRTGELFSDLNIQEFTNQLFEEIQSRQLSSFLLKNYSKGVNH